MKRFASGTRLGLAAALILAAAGTARAYFSYGRNWPAGDITMHLQLGVPPEFGHVLGLDHPDEATPVQYVDAVVNSHVSNTEYLTADDVAGVQSLYQSSTGTNPAAPVIVAQPAAATVQVTGSHTLNVVASGTGRNLRTGLTRAGGLRLASAKAQSVAGPGAKSPKVAAPW